MFFDALSVEQDRVTFGPQDESVSEGRLPDGSANVQRFFLSPSPGASNYVATYAGPVLNEVMARNVSAVYDSRGHNPDWIELRNPAGASFNLAGMGLSTGLGAAGRWLFPAGTTIASNGCLVVWCDDTRAASTTGSAELNSGFALKAAGETIYLFNTNGQVVDSVAFGLQVADRSLGRTGGSWALTAYPTPRAANAPNATMGNSVNLRINEWMALPASGNDWFELYNRDPLPVALGGLYVTDDVSIAGATNFVIAPLSFIDGKGWARFEADGDPSQGPDHAGFNLDRYAGSLRLSSASQANIDTVVYGLQRTGESEGRLPDGADQVVSFPTTPTPEASNYLPLTNVVINEVLTHTDPPLEDAIELYNPSGASVGIGGWYLSNSEWDLKKYRIPNGTTIAGRGYRVFYENQFNSTNAVPFTLNSAHGDAVLLSAADGAGNLTGYRAQVSFGAARNGVSFGRFATSIGTDWVAMLSRTFGVDNPASLAQFRTGTGLTNSSPRIGPVVINEIMYHPVTQSGTNLTENPDEEYLELRNITSGPVPLYDPAAVTNRWKLGGGIEYVFPGGVTLPAGGCVVVVGFDPVANPAALASFRAKYGMSMSVPVYGPFQGRLDNGGERIDLNQPDSPQAAPHPDAGFVPYVLVDGVTYGSTLPWPAGADGTGMSLQRAHGGDYGNEPLNWLACQPNPGLGACVVDSDGDGLPDDWETAHGLNPNSPIGNDGAGGDPDGDRCSNLNEYWAGTNPQDPGSYLKIESISPVADGVVVRFLSSADRSYSLEYRDTLGAGPWQRLADVEANPTNDLPVLIYDYNATTNPSRYYRLTTPKVP